MATLVMAAAHLAAVYLGQKVKLQVPAQHLFHAARRIYGVPELHLYAIVDGIEQMLSSSQRGSSSSMLSAS